MLSTQCCLRFQKSTKPRFRICMDIGVREELFRAKKSRRGSPQTYQLHRPLTIVQKTCGPLLKSTVTLKPTQAITLGFEPLALSSCEFNLQELAVPCSAATPSDVYIHCSRLLLIACRRETVSSRKPKPGCLYRFPALAAQTARPQPTALPQAATTTNNTNANTNPTNGNNNNTN